MKLKRFLQKVSPSYLYRKIRNYWHNFCQFMAIKSIKKAVHEQGFSQLVYKLGEIVPDITHQYSTFKVDTLYLTKKVRGEHAFQISLVQEAINIFKKSAKDDLIIADIGDSAGTHIQYIKSLFGDRNIRTISVNLDPKAVKRIREKGFEAICARAEEVGEEYSINADVFLCFEMLEHLMNPAEFLYKISKTNCKFFVITVPYLAKSRVGFHHIRNLQQCNVTPEDVHIFELSPPDWRLLFMHSGWSVVYDRVYLQYPRKGFWRFMKWGWRQYDFEGFYGVILKKDSNWSKLYTGW